MVDFDSIGRRLREGREALGLSQTELAEAVLAGGARGATRQTQSNYEKGERMPDAGYLAVAAELGIDVLHVLTGRREPKRQTSAGLPDLRTAEPPPRWSSAPPVRSDTTHPGTPAAGDTAGGLSSALLAPADVSVGRPMTLPVRFAAGDKIRGYQVVANCRAAAAAGRAGDRQIDDEQLHADPAGVLALEVEYMARTLGRTGGGFVTVTVSGDSMEPTLSDGDLIIVDTTRNSIDASGIYVLRVAGDLVVKRVHRRVDGSLTIKGDNPAYEPEHIQAAAVGSLQVLGRMTRLRLR